MDSTSSLLSLPDDILILILSASPSTAALHALSRTNSRLYSLLKVVPTTIYRSVARAEFPPKAFCLLEDWRAGSPLTPTVSPETRGFMNEVTGWRFGDADPSLSKQAGYIGVHEVRRLHHDRRVIFSWSHVLATELDLSAAREAYGNQLVGHEVNVHVVEADGEGGEEEDGGNEDGGVEDSEEHSAVSGSGGLQWEPASWRMSRMAMNAPSVCPCPATHCLVHTLYAFTHYLTFALPHADPAAPIDFNHAAFFPPDSPTCTFPIRFLTPSDLIHVLGFVLHHYRRSFDHFEALAAPIFHFFLQLAYAFSVHCSRMARQPFVDRSEVLDKFLRIQAGIQPSSAMEEWATDDIVEGHELKHWLQWHEIVGAVAGWFQTRNLASGLLGTPELEGRVLRSVRGAYGEVMVNGRMVLVPLNEVEAEGEEEEEEEEE
ncbi:hypothetical protein BJ508DRAFT_304354 [Ascobolus immersus RN42]|uniref:F-box domain-containing protein n=1 Tax=Ascobolus immersus RN42 TaxID=1160509 RepID=A0A3N4IGL6_ASCIM|nr:hypothetical protein BJ508DRAFT_304354 [Ascobolus immersus RN42]